MVFWVPGLDLVKSVCVCVCELRWCIYKHRSAPQIVAGGGGSKPRVRAGNKGHLVTVVPLIQRATAALRNPVPSEAGTLVWGHTDPQ